MASATTDDTFQKDVLDSDKPVLVDFWAPWCGPCNMLAPIIEQISQEMGENARVYKLNVDESPQTASRYGISAIPTVIVFKKGEVHKQIVGVQPKANYKAALES